MATAKTNDNDFFSLLEQEQKEANPGLNDEIIFRDKSGRMKVLKGGQVFDLDQNFSDATKPANQVPVSVQPTQNNLAPALPQKNQNQVQVVKNEIVQSIPEISSKPILMQSQPIQKSPVILDLPKQIDYQLAADLIIKQTAETVTDPDLLKRLKNIIISFLKNIRDRQEASEMLESSITEGGVGLNQELSDRILDTATVKRKSFETQQEDVSVDTFHNLQEEAEMILPKFEAEVIAAKPIMAVSSVPVTINKIEPKLTESKSIEPKAQKPLGKFNIPQTEKIIESTKKNETLMSDFSKKPKNQSVETNVLSSSKVESVKFKPQLLGPVEEIRTMSLVDFRRFDVDPISAVKKIQDKIELLGDQSLSEKIIGIKAWKESEPYRMYVALGIQAMEEKKTISEVIAERNANNQPTLTEQEIEEIMKLNEKLRY